MRRFGAMKTAEMAVQTEGFATTKAVQTDDVDLQEAQRLWSERSGLPLAPPNLLVPDKKIWMIPRGFFTSLGSRCGRWGPIAGFQSKSRTARQLKSEILPMFPEWDMLQRDGSLNSLGNGTYRMRFNSKERKKNAAYSPTSL